MNNNHYIIYGPFVDEETTFWNQEVEEWTLDEDYATKMGRDVLTTPLPFGTTAIIERDENGNMQSFLYTLPPIGNVHNIFEYLD